MISTTPPPSSTTPSSPVASAAMTSALCATRSGSNAHASTHTASSASLSLYAPNAVLSTTSRSPTPAPPAASAQTPCKTVSPAAHPRELLSASFAKKGTGQSLEGALKLSVVLRSTYPLSCVSAATLPSPDPQTASAAVKVLLLTIYAPTIQGALHLILKTMDQSLAFFAAWSLSLKVFLSMSSAFASKTIILLMENAKKYAEMASTWVRSNVTTEIPSMAMGAHRNAQLRSITVAPREAKLQHQSVNMWESR